MKNQEKEENEMIVVKIWEGLGNQLFQYAYAKSLQLRQNEKVYLDFSAYNNRSYDPKKTYRSQQLSNFRITLREYSNLYKYYFFLDEKNILNKGIKKMAEEGLFPYKYFKEENVQFKPELLSVRGNYYIQGWFQNERYFKEYQNVIRNELRLKNKIKIQNKLREILDYSNTVAVHVRRGDYKKHCSVLPAEYYNRAVERINGLIDNPLFCIFSDEIEWVKKNMKFEGKCFYVNEDHKLTNFEELIVMSCCKHDIIANSTYSWWGAWLNNNEKKIVIGPNEWFLSKSVLNANKGLTIMPESWIRL